MNDGLQTTEVSIPYLRVTHQAELNNLTKGDGFQSPIYGSRTSGHFKLEIINFLFQSPIYGSRTKDFIDVLLSRWRFQSPIYGSRTCLGLWHFDGSLKFQSPIYGSRTQQMKAVSSIVAIARAAQDLALAANQSTQLIKDAIGGHVLIRQNPDETNEILIMDNPDPDQAVKIWRWNMGGLGYSDNCVGADNPDREYEIAMTMDGAINANFIKTGQLDAGVVRIGPQTTFAPGYDPTQIVAGSTIGMGVDADCLGLWHFDGSLNSHKGVSATFTRASVAYLEDGTQVASGVPRFEDGKFGKGILIEEGTTNLFPLAKSVVVSGGSDSYAYSITSGLVQGGTYTLRALIKAEVNDGTVNSRMTIKFNYSDGTSETESIGPFPKDGIEREYILTRTANAAKTLTSISGWILDHSNPGTGKYQSARNIQLEQKPYPTSFVDGTRAVEDLTIPRSSVLPSLNAFTIAFRAYPHLTKIGLAEIAGTSWARTGFLEIGNYYAVNESNICVWKNNPDGPNAIKVSVFNNRIRIDSPKITLTQTEWAEGPMIVLRYDGSRMYLDTFTSVGHEQVSVVASITHPVADLIRIGRAGAEYINGIIDELRIDNVCRTDEEIAAWYKANAPFYTSEDMKQWPGYMRLETDGLKVYDSSDDLRVLVGSWVEDAIRKYGIRIIDGLIEASKIYGTSFQSGDKGATSYVRIGAGFEPLEIKENGKTALNIWSSNGGMMQFYSTLLDNMMGQISVFDDAAGTGLRIHARNNAGSDRKLLLRGSDIDLDASGTTFVENDLWVSGSIYSGSKSNVEVTANYGLRTLFVRESPNHKYILEGVSELVNGTCRIDIEPIFLECIEPNEVARWAIQLTPYAQASLWVSEIADTYFVVSSDIDQIEFAWTLSAYRKNFADIYLPEYVSKGVR
mgnify:CR=1 FL=1